MDKQVQRLRKTIQRIAILIGLFSLSPLSLFASVETSLKQLSYEERFFLRIFFRSFLKNDDFGHVLFCKTKPVCFGSIDKKCHRKSYHQKQLLKGWKCWKKNEHLFPHPNFIFLEEEFKINDEFVIHVFLIKKKTLNKTLHKNIDVFKTILGDNFSVESFINSIQTTQSLRPLLNHDEALMGVLLGYGVESPMRYKKIHENIDIENWEAPAWTEDYMGVEARSPKKCRINPVCFVGNPESPEVKALLEQYAQELNEIWTVYRQSKDSLKLVLDTLCTD